MRRIRYAGGTFITGDEAAAAVCDFAAALANAGRAAALDVPAVDEDGVPVDVEIVVGPASQVLSERLRSDLAAPDTEAFVREVRREIELLTWHPAPASPLGDWDV